MDGWVNTGRQLHFQYNDWTSRYAWSDYNSGHSRRREDPGITYYFSAIGDVSFGVWWRGE